MKKSPTKKSILFVLCATIMAGCAYMPIDNLSFSVIKLINTPLPKANRGDYYNISIPIKGGTPPYRFSLIRGDLPYGLELNRYGQICGIPTYFGEFQFTIMVRDYWYCIDTCRYCIEVTNEIPLTIETTSLPDGYVGLSYTYRINVLGSSWPYFDSEYYGELPPGLELIYGNIIHGIPRIPGSYIFIYCVRKDNGESDLQELILTILN